MLLKMARITCCSETVPLQPCDACCHQIVCCHDNGQCRKAAEFSTFWKIFLNLPTRLSFILAYKNLSHGGISPRLPFPSPIKNKGWGTQAQIDLGRWDGDEEVDKAPPYGRQFSQCVQLNLFSLWACFFSSFSPHPLEAQKMGFWTYWTLNQRWFILQRCIPHATGWLEGQADLDFILSHLFSPLIYPRGEKRQK